MIHYILLKLKPGADVDAAEARVKMTYQELDRLLDFLHEPVIYRSCVERDSNADIMIRVRLDSRDCLQDYLTHPAHLKMAQDMKDVLAARTTFDHM